MATDKNTGGVMEQNASEVLGEDDAPPPPMVVKTVVTQGKGKAPGARVVSNKEALDAIASLGGTGSTIWVERVEPVKHGGKKVQTGKLINFTLTPEDLTRNLPTTLVQLGRRGRLFRVGVGDRSAPIEVAGGALDLLDYEPEETQTVIAMGPAGPVPVQVPMQQAAPMPMSFAPAYSPLGSITPDAIAKAVAEAVGSKGKSEAYELKLLELEQRRQEREEKREAERKEREEKYERERKEREERAEKERKEREEREERRREEREKAERAERDRREEKERQERKEKEEREARERKEREEREKADRLERERRDQEARDREEKARERQHDLLVKLLTSQNNKDEGLIDKMVKLRQLDTPKDTWKDLERAMAIVGGGGNQNRGWADALVENLPEIMRAAAELKMAPPGMPVVIPQQQVAQQVVQQTQPAQVQHRPNAQQSAQPAGPQMDLPELLDALKSVGDAVNNGIAPAQAVAAMRSERAKGGTPNFVAICARQTPEALAEELKKVYASDRLTDEQKAVIAAFAPIGMSDAGKKWIMEFFSEARKA